MSVRPSLSPFVYLYAEDASKASYFSKQREFPGPEADYHASAAAAAAADHDDDDMDASYLSTATILQSPVISFLSVASCII